MRPDAKHVPRDGTCRDARCRAWEGDWQFLIGYPAGHDCSGNQDTIRQCEPQVNLKGRKGHLACWFESSRPNVAVKKRVGIRNERVGISVE